ncbi:hypothetical protein FZC33_00210 [Labrys sp. KNU-23]|uniref:hypothetical protein n=1 Tax=Labrys sp. KNU-23 TaxID=2789216 RepID=UPI0011ECE9DA|nr:hypothetical protein [Labrys sp. KNU-23]QEN84752.1 hypothetical protein FZC33_00210 [Labrys sp. KNU-23]
MGYHLEHKVRLNTEPTYGGLYRWAINEVDEQGRVVSLDLIPWNMSLYFTAISCVVVDGVDLGYENTNRKSASEKSIYGRSNRIIRVRLRRGHPLDEGDSHKTVTYSMLGTQREIRDFQLFIHPTNVPDEQMQCWTFGLPMFTDETQFRRKIKTEDCIEFHLRVKPDDFSRYAADISNGLVDELILRIKGVPGFYAGWTPDIYTREIKVLTAHDFHDLDPKPDIDIKLPRLGESHEATLTLNRSIEFEKADLSLDQDGHQVAASAVSETAGLPVTDPHAQMVQALRPLKHALWGIAALLVSILAILWSRH